MNNINFLLFEQMLFKFLPHPRTEMKLVTTNEDQEELVVQYLRHSSTFKFDMQDFLRIAQ